MPRQVRDFTALLRVAEMKETIAIEALQAALPQTSDSEPLREKLQSYLSCVRIAYEATVELGAISIPSIHRKVLRILQTLVDASLSDAEKLLMIGHEIEKRVHVGRPKAGSTHV